jgi:Lysyl oxidase
MRRTGLASVALSAALVLAGVGLSADAAGAAAGAPTPLLPDLVVRRITSVHIGPGAAARSLRFDTRAGNRGPGSLELFPDVPDSGDCDGDTDPDNDRVATQRVFEDTNGDGEFTRGIDDVASETVIGCFIFHPQHNHWHLEDFANYELRRPRSGAVVSSAEKVSFCLTDTGPFGAFPGTPPSHFYGACDVDATMGLSVGWYDLYGSPLAGQELPIKGVADARYCLAMMSDPANHITESDETNNTRTTLVRIRRGHATDLRQTCPGEPR